MDLAHLSTNPLCSLRFPQFTISPSTTSVRIHIAFPLRSWPIPQDPHHPHQTPSLGPFRANVVLLQIQACQGGVVLQSFCQCLTANKDQQHTWWNHLKCFDIHTQEISTPANAFFSYFLWYSHIMSVANEMKRTSSNSLRSAWWTWHISAPILCVVFLSHSSPFHLRLALSGSILPYLLPSWPIRQEFHHPHPNTKPEPRYHQRWSCPYSGLSGSSCASVLLPKPHSRQKICKIRGEII